MEYQAVKKRDKKQDSEIKVHKTPAFHPALRTNEILITRKKPKVTYLKRVHSLFFDLN